MVRIVFLSALAACLCACAAFPYEVKRKGSDRQAAQVVGVAQPDPAVSTDFQPPAGVEDDADEQARFDDPAKTAADLADTEIRAIRSSREPVIYAGTGRFIDRPGAVDGAGNLPSEDAVTLNFVDAPIDQAAKTIIGDILKANYVIEEGVQGTITLQTGSPIEREALLSVLETVLRPKGAAIVNEGDLFRIVPLATALRGGAGPRFSRGADLPGFGVHIEPLRFVAAAEMARILEPIAPQGAILRIDRQRNLLMLAGTQFELAALLDTVEIFDVDWLSGMSFGVFPVKSASPQAIITELETVFANETQGPLEGLIQFVPNDRLGAVMAITAQPIFLQHTELWISRLDAAGAGAAEQLYVYEVQNGLANELAEVLQSVITGDSGGGQRASTVAPNQQPIEITAPAGGDGAIQTASLGPSSSQGFEIAGEGSALVSGDRVSVVPYDAKNALVIVATPQDYENILGILEKLDLVSNQVLLEATIAEVTLNDALEFGVQWFFEEGDTQITLSDAASGAVGNVFPGFSFLLTRDDVQVALDALSSVTDVNILSSPSLMVVDNKTATLQVGDEVPIATQSSVGSTTAFPVFNSISFRDTGVMLSITPRVNESGMVLLEIEQEVSDVVATTTSGIDSPTIQQKRIQTTVVVNDGQAIALGGLIEDSIQRTSAGVPYVSRIPILGNLFKSRSDAKARTELLVLITPRVIRNMDEAQSVTDEFRRRLDRIAPLEDRLN